MSEYDFSAIEEFFAGFILQLTEKVFDLTQRFLLSGFSLLGTESN